MDRLIAIRIRDIGTELVVEGLISKGKSRGVAWKVISVGKDRGKLLEGCAAAEQERWDALPKRAGAPVDWEH